jgi:hypothetical protein
MRFWASFAFVAAVVMSSPASAESTLPQTPSTAAAQTSSAGLSGAHVHAEPAQVAIHSSVDAPTASAAPAAAASSAANLDEVVCKTLPPKLGSRIGGGRECRTQRVWNWIQRDSQEITRRQEQMGYVAN